MKKTVVLFALLVLGLFAKSQVTKIHTFETIVSNTWGFSENDVFFESCYYHFLDNTYYLYNWDFTLKKTFTITLVPEGYKVYSLFFTKKCFNNDDNFELIVIYQAINPVYQYPDINSQYKLWIINENNELLQEVETAGLLSFYHFHKKGEELRCSVYKYMYDEELQIHPQMDIYRCAGNGGNSVSIPEKSISNMNAYPNPAATTITLPYNLKSNAASEMRIYDIQGRLVRTINVGPHFNEIILNVSDFPNGVYIYECDGVSNKFIVE